jgi:protein TonB
MVQTLATTSNPLPQLPWLRMDYGHRSPQPTRKAAFLALAVGLQAAVIAGFLSLDVTRGISRIPLPDAIRLILPDPPAEVKPPEPKPPELVKPVRSIEKPMEPPPAATDVEPEVDPGPTVITLPATNGPIDPPQLAKADPQPTQPLVRKGMTPVYRVSPVYPITARRNGIEGRVLVHLHVDPDGTVKRVQIVEATPRGVFEREVVKVLMQWRFAPEAVGFIGEVEIGFRLSGTETEG